MKRLHGTNDEKVFGYHCKHSEEYLWELDKFRRYSLLGLHLNLIKPYSYVETDGNIVNYVI